MIICLFPRPSQGIPSDDVGQREFRLEDDFDVRGSETKEPSGFAAAQAPRGVAARPRRPAGQSTTQLNKKNNVHLHA